MTNHKVRRACLPVSILALAWLLPAVAGERIYFNEENRSDHEYAAYSRAVNALPIDPADGDQVRVWIMGYWGGRMPITGYILTNRGAYRCKLSYNNDTGEYLVINRGHCAGPRKYPERLAAAMASLPELAKYDSDTASCDTMDGWGADIEGIVGGKRFRFTASNPDDCDSARPVRKLLDLIEGAFYKKDRD